MSIKLFEVFVRDGFLRGNGKGWSFVGALFVDSSVEGIPLAFALGIGGMMID